MASETEILVNITDLFRELFVREDLVLSPETTAEDVPGWDSFKHIEIIMAVEERFKVKLTTREVDGLKSVGDLAKIVGRKA